MLIRIFTLLFTSFIYSALIIPQTPPYFHYTTSDGLGSSMVYSAFQDRDGFMWFGTQNGLSRFDGKKFINYTIKDGLGSDVITYILQGKNNELYVSNFEKGVDIFFNGKAESYFDKTEGKEISISQMIEYRDNIYAYHKFFSPVIFKEKSMQKSEPKSTKVVSMKLYRLAEISGDLIAATTDGLYRIIDDRTEKINVKGLGDRRVYSISQGSGNSFYIGTNGSIFQIKNYKIIREIKADIYDMNEIMEVHEDKKGNIWFTINGRGFFLILKDSEELINIGSKLDLDNTHICNFFEDNEGNIWISTFGKGVYCLTNLHLKNFSEKDGLNNNNIQSIIKVNSGKIIIGTYKGVNILDGNNIIQVKKSLCEPLMGDVFGLKTYNDTIFVSWGQQAPVTVERVSADGLEFLFLVSRSYLKTNDGYYLFGGWGNNISVSVSSIRENHYSTINVLGDTTQLLRIYDLLEDSENNIWAGTANGLCMITRIKGKSLKEGVKKTLFKDDPVLSSRINFIHEDKKKNVWFAGIKGIARYSLSDRSVVSYTSLKGVDLPASTSIVSDKKNRLWIGCTKGLYLYDGFTLKYISSQSGLPSDEVLSLFYDDNKNNLYIGTSNGVSVLDIEWYDNLKVPSLAIKIYSVKAGDSVYTNFENLVFNPEQNNVYINFNAINFSSPASVRYKYKLNNDWVETENDFLNFLALKSGTYNLEMRAKSINSEWSNSYFLSFTVEPRFTETIWYRVTVILSLIGVSLLFFALNMKRKTRKMKEELELTERINELKHQALSAMMNPHFIFNSLNSVQYLVNDGRYEEANDYIAMMAKLMRKNLETAGNGFILLSEEISRLKLYLDLEKLRFGDRFSYGINTGEDLNTQLILIPNMIIQPFVENSLWHGIINSGTNGILTVEFLFEDAEVNSVLSKVLIIKVTDNGIGFKQAQKNKKEDHISKGISIIEERLKLISSKMSMPPPVMFEDLGGPNHNSHGTEIIISLPPPLYKFIS